CPTSTRSTSTVRWRKWRAPLGRWASKAKTETTRRRYNLNRRPRKEREAHQAAGGEIHRSREAGREKGPVQPARSVRAGQADVEAQVRRVRRGCVPSGRGPSQGRPDVARHGLVAVGHGQGRSCRGVRGG